MTILHQYAIYLIVVAFIVGAWFGFFIACLLVIGRESDERAEREQIEYLSNRRAS